MHTEEEITIQDPLQVLVQVILVHIQDDDDQRVPHIVGTIEGENLVRKPQNTSHTSGILKERWKD